MFAHSKLLVQKYDCHANASMVTRAMLPLDWRKEAYCILARAELLHATQAVAAAAAGILQPRTKHISHNNPTLSTLQMSIKPRTSIRHVTHSNSHAHQHHPSFSFTFTCQQYSRDIHIHMPINTTRPSRSPSTVHTHDTFSITFNTTPRPSPLHSHVHTHDACTCPSPPVLHNHIRIHTPAHTRNFTCP